MILHEKDRYGNLMPVSVFSRLTFSWISNTLKYGNRSSIQEKDLLEPSDKDSAKKLSQELEKHWNIEESLTEANPAKKGPALLRALLKVFRPNLVVLLLWMFLDILGRILVPVLIGLLVAGLQAVSARETDMVGLYLCLVFLSGSTLLFGVTRNNYLYSIETLGSRIRAAVMGLIYNKLLRLSQTSIHDVISGHLTKLVSNDCEKLEVASFFIPHIIVFPLEVIVITALAWRHVGWLSLVATGFVVGLIPVQILMGRICGKIRYKITRASNQRVQLTSEILTAIRAVKMYVWETPLSILINKIRRRELKFIRRCAVVSSFQQILQCSSLSLVALMIFPSLMFLGKELTATKVFATLVLYSCLATSVLGYVARGMMRIPEALVAMQRIEHFMKREELRHKAGYNYGRLIGNSQHFVNDGFEPLETSKAGIELLSFDGLNKQNGAESEETRKEKGGPESGQLGRISFQNASFDWNKLSRVLDDISLDVVDKSLVCVTGPAGCGKSALILSILNEIPLVYGHLYKTGRTVYVPQIPWVFSGTLRENILFDSPYAEKRYWKVIYACELDKDIGEFPDGDLTLVGNGGISLTTGQRARVSLARAAYCEADIYLMDDILHCVDERNVHDMMKQLICGLLTNSCRVLVSRNHELLEHSDHVVIVTDGRIKQQGSFAELKDFLTLLYSDNQMSGESRDTETIHIHEKKKRRSSSSSDDELVSLNISENTHAHDDDRTSGTLPWSMYWKYMRSTRSIPGITFLVLLMVSGQGLMVVTDWWLARWSNMELGNQQERLNVSIFGSLVLLSVVFAFCRPFDLFLSLLKTSARLHDNMLAAVLKAQVTFFDSNPAEKIMNRFSRDMANMDELLPYGCIESIQSVLSIISIVVLSVAVNYWVSLVAVPLLVTVVYLGRYVLRSTRDLRRLQTRYRWDALSHCSTTLCGLTCIRAYNAQQRFLQQFYGLLDRQTSPCVMFYGATRWLCLRGDLVCSLFIVAIAVSAVLTTADAGYTGLSLLYAMHLLELTQWAIRVTAETENTMRSFEGVSVYADLEPEPGYAFERRPSKVWPQHGDIKCENISLSFTNGELDALKAVDLTILPKEKIAVIGPKGAGKSLLIGAFFRMPQTDGRIIIDGNDINTIDLRESRRRIAMVSQKPFLLNSSLRFNLDPSEKFSDNELWSVLQQLKLDRKLLCQPRPTLRGSTSGFSNLERKLVCLARAQLEHQMIICIEEEENPRSDTDRRVQEVVETHFKDRTVIIVAHRLETIMACDRVVVMRDGRVVEFDSPEELSGQEDSEMMEIINRCSY